MELIQYRALSIFVIVLITTLHVDAQSITEIRRGSFALGGDVGLQLKSIEYESSNHSEISSSGNLKFGCFISPYDLIMIRPGYSYERSSRIGSNWFDSRISFGMVITYRRYFGTSLFSGLYVGGDYVRNWYEHSSSPTVDYDKAIKAGAEIGYTYFLKPNVGIEASMFFEMSQIGIERGTIEYYTFIQGGVNIGFLYLFKLRKL